MHLPFEQKSNQVMKGSSIALTPQKGLFINMLYDALGIGFRGAC
jgi:hypothetical protein